jgi:hypothetical protein
MRSNAIELKAIAEESNRLKDVDIGMDEKF